MSQLLAVDFDGTLAQPDCYPDIGAPNEPLIRKLRECHKAGDRIIIWTCRHGEHIERMRAWLDFMGVPFDLVNENDPERVARFGNDCRKLGADVYIDDKAIHPDDWVRDNEQAKGQQEQAKAGQGHTTPSRSGCG